MRGLILSVAMLSMSLPAFAANLANGERINKNCALCHGIYGQGAPGQLSPRIAGLPKDYIIKTRTESRAGRRV